MACQALWNTTCDESFHSDVLYEINFIYSNKESENKDAECIFLIENSPKVNEKKFGLSVQHLDCTAAENTECICDFYK